MSNIKYEHIAKFRNDKGERVKLVIKSDRAVVVFKSPLGAIYEKTIERNNVLTRKGQNVLDLYLAEIESVATSVHKSLGFDQGLLTDITNEIFYCGVS